MTDAYEEFKCPISHQIFLEPVIAEDGHVYEKHEIEKWFKKGNRSPLTNEDIFNTVTHPCFYMKQRVDAVIKLNPWLKDEQYKMSLDFSDDPATVIDAIIGKRYKDLLKYRKYRLETLMNQDYINSFTQFIRDCKNIDIITFVIENSIDLCEAKCSRGLNMLHLICNVGDSKFKLQLIKYLVECKQMDIHSKTQQGSNILHILTKVADIPAIQYAIEKGVDVRGRKNDGSEPIHMACGTKEDVSEVVHFLKCRGANLNIADQNDERPLYTAVRHGNEAVVRYLLKNGADYSGAFGKSLFTLACRIANIAMVQLFLDTGFAVHGQNGVTYINEAAYAGSTDIIKLLVSKGVALDSGVGEMLITHANSYYNMDLLKYLVEQGVPLTQQSGNTIIATACIKNNVELLKLVLSKKVPIANGARLLGSSCGYKFTEIVLCLLQNGCDIESEYDGYKLIQLACKNNLLEVVQYLIEKGVNLESEEPNYQMRPIHFACRYSSVAITKLLLEKGVDMQKSGADRHAISYLPSNQLRSTYDKQTILQLLSVVPDNELVSVFRSDY